MVKPIINRNKDKIEKIYFIFSRLAGLGTKSLFIWSLLKAGHSEDSYTISLYYLCLTSTMVLYNNEAYFDYYKYKFGNYVPAYRLLKSKIMYIENITIHIVVFALLVFVGNYILTKKIMLSIFFLTSITLEKILDEIQRFNLFAKKFSKWSSIFLIYTLMPPLFTILFVLKGNSNIWIIYLSCLVGTLIGIIYLNLPSFFIYRAMKVVKSIRYSTITEYIKIYKEKYIYNQILAYTSNNILVFDKWLLVLVSNEKQLLAGYYLISQFANAINLVIDYFFISIKRAYFVQRGLSFSEIIDGKKLILLSILAFTVYVCGISVFLFFQEKSNLLSILQSILIGFSFLIYGFFSPISQYLFWHITRIKMIYIDTTFYISIIIIAATLHYLFLVNIINSIIISALLAHIVRSFFFYVSFPHFKNED
jgi:hypothetical protein